MSPCPSCGAGLADDQRYCLECGARSARLPFRFPIATEPPTAHRRVLPLPSSAAALTAVVLGTGVLMGAAVGPTVTGTSSASQRPTTIVLQGPSQGQGGGEVAGAQTASLDAPAGNVPQAPAAAPAHAKPAEPVVAQAPDAPAAATPPPPTPQQPAAGHEPAQPVGTPVKGVVVHVNAPAHSYALASEQGQLIAVHAAHLPQTGDKLATRIHPLANGTFGQAKTKTSGRSDGTTFAGTVTFVDATSRIYTVSAPGASVLVHAPAPPPPGSPPPPALPQPGQLVTVTVDIATTNPPPPGTPSVELREQKLAVEGTASGAVDLEGIVGKIDRAASTITLSADDARESGQDITLHAGPKVSLQRVRLGQPMVASARLEPGPTYTLLRISEDSGP